MKTFRIITLLLVFMLAIFLGNMHAGEEKKITKTFKAKEMVKFQTISGDCIIKKGKAGEITVHLEYDSTRDMFKPRMEEEDNALVLRDKLSGSGGDSVWTIFVPEKTNIKSSAVSGDFSVEGLNSEISAKTVSGEMSAKNCSGQVQLISVSGDYTLENLKGDLQFKGASSDMDAKNLSGKIEIHTASGDIDAEKMDGEISVKVASGDIDIKGAKGEFKIKTASGDIDASGISIEAESMFKVASGDVEISLAKSVGHDLTLASASGNVVLDYNGNPIKGWFEFKARADRGEIICPFKFDKEEVVEKWGKKYDVKSFKRGGDTPKVYIHTATGKAVLEK